MTSNEYVEGAIRTESGRFDAINVDPATIKAVFSLFVAAGSALDALKRGLYYGKPVNAVKLHAALGAARVAIADYQSLDPVELRGYSSAPAVHPRVVHAALGLGTESAEVIEKVLESFADGSDFDYGNLFEELGDGQWYTAVAIDTANAEDPESSTRCVPQVGTTFHQPSREWTYEAIWEKNLGKLKARYPEKFDTQKAYDRDLAKEKEALDGQPTQE